MIYDPGRIARELWNCSALPEPGRGGPVKKFCPTPARPAFSPARLTSLVYKHFCNRYFIITIDLDPQIVKRGGRHG